MAPVPGQSSRTVPGKAVEPGAELLHRSERTEVWRQPRPEPGKAGDSRRVIRKHCIDHGVGAERVRAEAAMLERLAHVPGVARLVPGGAASLSLVTEDTGHIALVEFLRNGQRPDGWLPRFSVDLTRVLAGVHAAGVVHGDISSGNVLVRTDGTQPMLVDFELATTFAEDRPEFVHPRRIAGTLPYLAPEQTGRVCRAVDHRADLYALGALLYEAATGRPPFGLDSDDPLDLIHAHLARPPLPPAELDPGLGMFSAIVMRLLEKEPDHRYQSAEGLAHDLARWAASSTGECSDFVLGGQDFPLRLAAPSRLVGRHEEIAALSDAYQGLRWAPAARGLLVSGAPGVGKTALLDELRPLVTMSGTGWLVSGKFDQYRQDQAGDAVVQALHGLGRMLLAEPEPRSEEQRDRLLSALGPNAGLLAATLPELATLLQVTPHCDDGDPAESASRVHRAFVDLLAAVATTQRPVVMVVDDLQWAPSFALGALDAILTDAALTGVLVVGGYRDSEVGPAHPLTAMKVRWERLNTLVATLRLQNLPPADLGTFLAEMLRLPAHEVAELAATIAAHTGGNPFDTVEVVNALRREGGLRLTEQGWRWDAGDVRRFVGNGGVPDLIDRRMAGLPQATRDVMQSMACLGGAVNLTLLPDLVRDVPASGPGGGSGDVADGGGGGGVAGPWVPALEEGLLVLDRGGIPAARFRHDRVQQAVRASLAPSEARARHLVLARRLSGRDEFTGIAAEQYLACVEDLTDVAERHHAIGVFAQAAERARKVANHEAAERYLSAAIRLFDEWTEVASAEDGGAGDDRVPGHERAVLREQLAIEHHSALCAVQRRDEADEVFGWIERNCADVTRRAQAVAVQLGSLINRGLLAEALALGSAILALLGNPVPRRDELGEQIGGGLDVLRAWASGGAQPDLEQAETTDPRILAVGEVINRMAPAAFFAGDPLVGWLVTDAARLWDAHGPAPTLVGPIAHAAFITIGVAGDYRTGHGVLRRVLAESRARGYELAHSQALFLHSLSASSWFEPPGETLRNAREAHEGLVRGGDSWNAAYAIFASIYPILSTGETLVDIEAEIDAGLAFGARTGCDMVTDTLVIFRQAARALRGLTAAPGSLSDDSFDAEAHCAGLGPESATAANFHVYTAWVAAVFAEPERLVHHAAAAMSLLPFVEATPISAQIRVWQGMGLAARYRATDPGDLAERTRLLEQFEDCRSWLEHRATDMPTNFAHVHLLVVAEGAWAIGDFAAAVRTFDAAQEAAEGSSVPGLHAFIVERAARFDLANGLEHAGQAGLRRARRLYARWGAAGKVSALDREFAFLRALPDVTTQPAARPVSVEGPRSTAVTTDAVDTLAILRAFQILSTETSPAGLQDQVAEVLALMTGATRVRLVLWDPDAGGWALPRPGGNEAASLPVVEAAAAGFLPLSVFRYVERTREALVVSDALRDDRFSHDSYFEGVPRCALLTVPILSRGALRAVLLLENRLARGVFVADRLDAVMLIAGELGVCLDNVLAERFRSLVQRSAELTLVCDRAGTISYASAAAVDLLGIPEGGLLGRRLPELLPAEEQQVLDDLMRTVSPGEPATVQTRVLHVDGQSRWVEATLTDLTGDQAVGGVMLRLRDITERHRLEIELRHAQKLESVGQLAAGIAHEINTPVQFISSNLKFLADAFQDLAGVLQRAGGTDGVGAPEAEVVATAAPHGSRPAPRQEAGDGADSEIGYLLEEIPAALAETTQGAERVATIVQAMKAFGRPVGESKAHADLNEAVRNTLVVAGNVIRPHADVVSDLAELPPAWCSVSDINQVMLNLVVNAAQAMGDKAAAGGTRGTLTVRTRQQGEDVLIEVQDTGAGIPAQIGERVFDQFFTTKPVGRGTGQGLALAHTLVHDRHGGTLTFESTPGEGTTFTIRLPIHAE